MSVTPDPDPDRPPLRASDRDREQVASVLQQAMSEGRISVGELETRLDSVYAAKTLGELEPITRDLPGHAVSMTKSAPVAFPAARGLRMSGGGTSNGNIVGIMSGVERKGIWTSPGYINAVAIMGGLILDFTGAQLTAMETVINVTAIMGGVEITVPEGLTVVVEGVGIMGAFDDQARQSYGPGSPVLRVKGVAIMGGVEVKAGQQVHSVLTDDALP